MKKLNLDLKATEAFTKDFAQLLSYNPNFLNELFTLLKSEKGLIIEDSDSLYAFLNENKIKADETKVIFSIIQFLYDSITKEELDVDESLIELEKFCEEKSISGFTERKTILKKLLEPTELFIKRKTYLPWASAIIPNLTAIGGTVELRAAFSERDSTQISGYIPVVQIRLICEHDYKDGADIIYHFQATEESFERLIKNIETFKKQLKAVKDNISDKINIIEKL